MIRVLCVLFGTAAGIFTAPPGVFLEYLLLVLLIAYTGVFLFNVLFRPDRLLPGAASGRRFNTAGLG